MIFQDISQWIELGQLKLVKPIPLAENVYVLGGHGRPGANVNFHLPNMVSNGFFELKMGPICLKTGGAEGHGKHVCYLCPPGSFSQEGKCHFCPEGSYSKIYGARRCIKCIPGFYGMGFSINFFSIIY